VVTPFTLTNAGESASDALALSITGPAASHYSVTAGTCAGTMAAGATCSGTVTFAAGTTPGSAPGDVLDATLNASVAGSAVALDFSAWAVAPTILGMQQSAGGAPMGTMAFGTATSGQTPVGTSSSVMSVWVGNAANAMTTGLLTLTLGDKVNFAIDTTNCPLATNVPLPTSGLVGGGSCQVDIIFTPKTLPANATFTTTLTASEAGGSTPAVLAITGYAKSALSCGASPLNAVTNSTTSPKEIVCSLALGAPTTSYLKTSLTGTDFMVVWDDCLVTKLSSNQSCSVFVAFIGTAPTTNKTSTLTVNGGVAGNSASVVINSSTP
jgi:hypothetical protein